MSGSSLASERAVILAPDGRDGQLARQILCEGGFAAIICADAPAVGRELEQGAALAIIADEAIPSTDLRPLTTFLERQPPWSDFPIILLTHHGAQRLIDGAIQGAERGASLTQRMLAFARQQDLRTNSMDIASLLTDMQDLLERSLGPQIALRLSVSAGLSPAQVDANQVELAILNLAINARDAMPDGGAIEIRADQTRGDRDRNLPAESYIRVRVSDTGRGKDAATLKKAVEPFFSTKPLGKGTGLCLSMVHGLAVQLGGLLELSSEIGKGTVATLWLPVATIPAASAISPAPQNSPGRAAVILVVDDDPLIAMSTVDMLEDLGHTVIEANSARQALEIVETGQALDLMMTDQAMPGMTGIELAEIVRSKRPNLPVLLATGYADLPSGQKSVLPRLSKPYRQSQLQSEIERLLGRNPDDPRSS